MGLLNCVWTLIYPVASHLLLLPWLDGQEEKKLIFIVWCLLLELFLILWNISLSGINSEHLPGLTKSPMKAWKSILMALWICVDECAECQSNRMMVSFNWLWKSAWISWDRGTVETSCPGVMILKWVCVQSMLNNTTWCPCRTSWSFHADWADHRGARL